MTYLKQNDEFDHCICCYCFNIVSGPEKSKGAEFYRINSKIYCSLNCYQEEKIENKPVEKTKLVKAKIKKVSNKKVRKNAKTRRPSY